MKRSTLGLLALAAYGFATSALAGEDFTVVGVSSIG